MINQNNLTNSLSKKIPPLTVLIQREGVKESFHKVHAAICDTKGRVLMHAGDFKYETFIRSALKPFQAIPFLTSGTSETLKSGEKGIAIACGSHMGAPKHAREAFRLLWNADIDVSSMQCPTPSNHKSNLQHNCSGKHAAFLATCKKMNWSLENYLSPSHPIQKEIRRRISDILCIPVDELVTATDNCGAPTLLLEINQMAKLYANLSCSDLPELEQINRAIINNPDLISGEGGFDTEVMKRAHSQIISKGGSEGIQCIGRLGEGLGLAIKVEDGSRRAKQSVAIHLLRQLEWITPTAIDELEQIVLPSNPVIQYKVEGDLKNSF